MVAKILKVQWSLRILKFLSLSLSKFDFAAFNRAHKNQAPNTKVRVRMRNTW